jgi:hypothetical protein
MTIMSTPAMVYMNKVATTGPGSSSGDMVNVPVRAWLVHEITPVGYGSSGTGGLADAQRDDETYYHRARQWSSSSVEVMRTQVQPVSLQTRLSAVPGSARL